MKNSQSQPVLRANNDAISLAMTKKTAITEARQQLDVSHPAVGGRRFASLGYNGEGVVSHIVVWHCGELLSGAQRDGTPACLPCRVAGLSAAAPNDGYAAAGRLRLPRQMTDVYQRLPDEAL